MSELVRSVVSKFSRFIVDRRGEPRVSVRLPFSISIQGTNGNGGRERLLEGYTRDVSAGGLGLIVHTVRIDGYCIVVDGRPRKLVLQLPNGPVTMSVLPVRSERLGDSGAGYIIGAQITAIEGEDEPAKCLRHMKVWLRRPRRLPGQIAPAGTRTNTTKQVDAPTLTTLRLVNPMVPGNAHRDSYSIRLDMRRRRHVRMKLPICLVLLRRPMNR
jgi:hypothetical protein